MKATVEEICRLFAFGAGCIEAEEMKGLVALRGWGMVEQALDYLKRIGFSFKAERGDLLLLSTGPDITPEAIHARTHTREFGRGIHHFSEVDSTNSQAKALAEEACAEGTLVVSETQTKGRGRMDRKWFSPPGKGLWFSIILRPTIDPSETASLTLLTAVSLAESIAGTCEVTPLISWPNDLLLSGRKFAGILAEAAITDKVCKYVIMGVGVNVNIAEGSFPAELAQSSTSLLIETGKTQDRALLLGAFLSIFEEHYLNYIASLTSLTELLADKETLRGLWVEVVLPPKEGETVVGKVLGYGQDGSLHLQDENGRVHHFTVGSARLLPS